tara:strand:- start:454 stop:615 length:162 start_codon:yes stop_codon:yes gene_type:complete
MYHGIKISYDSYNLINYLYDIIPINKNINKNTENNGVMLYELEKQEWNYIEII